MLLTDRYGRLLTKLRISVTKHCNLNCCYCHREGELETQISEMTVSEIRRIVEVGANLGIYRVKITGGEPLLRFDLEQIISEISKIPQIKDLSMVTNATLMADRAKALRTAGLMRVNINFPSLDAETFRKVTSGRLEDMLSGVEACISAGFNPVKLNVVILRGINDQELGNIIKYATSAGAILQLIELEPVNVNYEFYRTHHRTLNDMEQYLSSHSTKVEVRHDMHGRKIYHVFGGRVEVVRPIDNPEFCAHCTCIRLTADGKLKPCLMRNDNLIDILTPLRMGASYKELEAYYKRANELREPFYKT